MLESAHRPSEQTPWLEDKREQPHAFIRALMRAADPYFCAQNTRTKHNMVKDAKVGEIPSFRKKLKCDRRKRYREMWFAVFF